MMNYTLEFDFRDSVPKFDCQNDFFILIGFIWTVWLVLHLTFAIFRGIRTHIWSRLVKINFKHRYGEWAVVTGCTDGIGLMYARQLAARGLSLVLVGRNVDKLNKVKTELKKNHGSTIEVVTIVADFNNDDPSMYQRVMREIDANNRDIGVLVNFAGVMFDTPNRFLNHSETQIFQLMRVNMLSLVMMTRIVLPSMILKQRGLVVNMSSLAAYQPLPLLGVYSATKAFVDFFSRSLDHEYRQYNIEVQTLTPNFIGTKMTTWSNMLQKPSLLFPSVEDFTKNAFATVGRSRYTCGYWFHDLGHFFPKLMLSKCIYRSISWYFIQSLSNAPIVKNVSAYYNSYP